MPASTSTPAELFASLSAARGATDAANAERIFLDGLPTRLSISGAIFAYGMASDKRWAKWGGGLALAWIGVDYFASRRRAELAAAPVTVPDRRAQPAAAPEGADPT